MRKLLFMVLVGAVTGGGVCLDASEVKAGPIATLDFTTSVGTGGPGATNTTSVTATPTLGGGVSFVAGGAQEVKDAFGTPGQFEITLLPFKETATNFHIKVTSILAVPIGPPPGDLQITDRFFFFAPPGGTTGVAVNNTPGIGSGGGTSVATGEDGNENKFIMTINPNFTFGVLGPPNHTVQILNFMATIELLEAEEVAPIPELPAGTMVPFGVALLGIILYLRRRRVKA